MSQQAEPHGPMKPQSQPKPGLDSAMDPQPNYQAPLYKGSGKLAGQGGPDHRRRSGIGRAVAVLYAREGADVAIVYLSDEQIRRRGDAAGGRGRGAKLPALPGDVKDPELLPRGGREDRARVRRLDILVNNAAYPEAQEVAGGHHRRAVRHDLPHEHLRLFLHGEGGRAAPAGGAAIINCGSITGIEGSKDVDRLLQHQGGDPRLHQVTGPEPGGAGHPGELRRAGADLDAAPAGVRSRPRRWPSTGGTRRWGGRGSRRRSPRPSYSSPPRRTRSYINGEILAVLGGEVRAG